MNLLDWLLVALVLTYALSGYWQGFVTGAFATAGLLIGGLIGVWLAPIALGDANPSVLVSLGALFIVILSATLGQAAFQFAGAKLRDRISWQPFRAVDAVGGAALSGLAVLLVAWALGVAIAGSGISGITPMVRGSAVLKEVDEVLPESADGVLRAFNNVVGTTFFPRYLEPFAPERIVEVAPGPKRLLRDPDVVRAEGAVVKIQSSNSCGRGIEGSGFLFARDRVMTNAHVVAGVENPSVQIGDETVAGVVVYYDPDVDVAVIAVESGEAPTLVVRPHGRGQGGGRDPRLPRGRPLRRGGREGALPTAASLAQHLRRGCGHPRRALTAGQGAPGQLGWTGRDVGRRRRRSGVRRFADRRRDGLRADGRAGRAGGGSRAGPRGAGRHRRLRRLTSSATAQRLHDRR